MLAIILLLSVQDERHRGRETPYLTAIAGAMLLFIAILVPFTFLFLRRCGGCISAFETSFFVEKVLQ